MKTFLFFCAFFLYEGSVFGQLFKAKLEVISPIEKTILLGRMKDFNVLRFDLPAIRSSIKSKGQEPFQLQIYVNGTQYNLRLEENEIRSVDCKQVLLQNNRELVDKTVTECHTYKGTVDGDSKREVRLLISDNLFIGYISTSAGRLYFESIRRFLTIPDFTDERIIVFKPEDLKSVLPGICNSVDSPQSNISPPKKSGGRASAAVPTSCRILELATEGDQEWFNKYGNQSWDQILNIVNQVESLYQSSFNMRISVTYMSMWTGDDPYYVTGIFNGTPALNELRDVWNAGYTPYVKRDLVHMFTARDFSNSSGQLLGVHYSEVICSNPSLSYGLTIDSPLILSNTTAHEIGHGFGGRHPNEDNDPAQSDCNTSEASVMCQGDKKFPPYFSTQQFNRVNTYIQNHEACLIDYSSFEIGGPDKLCNSATYSAYGPRNYQGRVWTSSPNITLSVDPNYTYTAVATAGPNGAGWVEASFNAGCAVTVRKNINVTCAGRLAATITDSDDSDSGISVYPNPTGKNFKVRLNTVTQPTEISITNVSGKGVFSQVLSNKLPNDEIEVDLGHQKTGVYIVKVVTPTQVYVRKIVVER